MDPVALLQRHCLFRTEYEGKTLRENLGLERLVNQFSVQARKAASRNYY